MFQGQAEEAMRFYVSLLPGSEIIELRRYGPGEAGAEGAVMLASFSLCGQAIMCIDSPIPHDFGFTPAFSLFADCVPEEEVDRFAAALAEDGATLMPLGSYGFSRRFTWVNDRYGVSWQLNLPWGAGSAGGGDAPPRGGLTPTPPPGQRPHPLHAARRRDARGSPPRDPLPRGLP
jgi:predicted 3-demethylubiquinone-9 3-methyltransferase (glyoxalase superfamily)